MDERIEKATTDKPKEERLYTRDEVLCCIRGACRDGQQGYDPYDLLIEDYLDRR